MALTWMSRSLLSTWSMARVHLILSIVERLLQRFFLLRCMSLTTAKYQTINEWNGNASCVLREEWLFSFVSMIESECANIKMDVNTFFCASACRTPLVWLIKHLSLSELDRISNWNGLTPTELIVIDVFFSCSIFAGSEEMRCVWPIDYVKRQIIEKLSHNRNLLSANKFSQQTI